MVVIHSIYEVFDGGVFVLWWMAGILWDNSVRCGWFSVDTEVKFICSFMYADV